MGAGIAAYFTLPFEPSTLLLILTPLLATAVWFTRHIFGARLLLGALLATAMGFNAAQIETISVMHPMMDRDIGPAPVTGTLMVTEVMPEGMRLTLKNPSFEKLPPERTPEFIRIRMNNVGLADLPPPGSTMRVMAQAGAYSEPVAPQAYDFRRVSFFQQLGGVGWSRGKSDKIEVLDTNPPHSITDQFNLFFERMRRAITLRVYARLNSDADVDAAAMTAALLNGEQSSISKPVMQAMRVSGLSHILSISGLHVSMMGLLVYIPLRALLALIPFIALRFPIKKWAAGAAILSTAFYTIFVGSQAPTLRSALGTSILMFAILADRRTQSMRLLALAAFIVMLLQPDGVMGPSFQMSFAAVLCMVAAFEKPLDRALAADTAFSLPAWMRFITRHAWTIVATSVIATAATTPFSIYHFQTFSFYGVAANMLGVPVTSFWIMPCLLLTYLTAPFGWDDIFIDGAGIGVKILMAIANQVSTWPYALIHLPAMPDVALILIVVGGLWLCLWRMKWRYAGLALILAGACYPLYTTTPDFLVTDDGKQWAAVLNDGRMVVGNLDREKFTVTQWQQRLGFPDALDVDELPANETQVRCVDAGCVYTKHGHILAIPKVEAAALEDCARADIIVGNFVMRDCKARTIIDDPALWHKGAHALYISEGNVRVETVRERRGQRPWSAGWGYAHRIDN